MATEGETPVVETVTATPAAAVEEPKKKATREKKPKATKEKKPKESKTASHPPYFQMIEEAILALNEKSGSSPYAIAKYMEGKHKAVLPANFKKILALQLKNSAAKGKLIKIKASYKLSDSGKKDSKTTKTITKTKVAPKTNATTTRKRTRSATAARAKPEVAKKPAAAAKKSKKSTPAKPKQPKSIKSPAAKKAKKATAA